MFIYLEKRIINSDHIVSIIPTYKDKEVSILYSTGETIIINLTFEEFQKLLPFNQYRKSNEETKERT